MENSLSVSAALKLVKLQPNVFAELEKAQGDYQKALNSQEPLINEIKTSFTRINLFYEKAGLKAPFVLDYNVIEQSFKDGQKRREDLEKERDEAHEEYRRVVDYVTKNLGVASPEGQKMITEAKDKWDKLNDKISSAWKNERKAEELMTEENKKNFIKNNDSIEYFEKLYKEANERNNLGETVANRQIIDDMTTIMIKKELSGISYCLEALKEKQNMMKHAMVVKDDICYRFSKENGINLQLHFDQEPTDTKEKVQENSLNNSTPSIDNKEKKEEVVEQEKKENDLKNKNNGLGSEQPVIPDLEEEKLDDPSNVLDNYRVNNNESLVPVSEQEKEDFEPEQMPDVNEVDNNDKIKGNRRYKVTKQRRASINGYIKAMLTGGGIAAVSLAFAKGAFMLTVGSVALPTVIVGAGVGAALYSGLFRKAKITPTYEEEYNNAQTDEEKANCIVKDCRKGLNEYRNKPRQDNLNPEQFAQGYQDNLNNLAPELAGMGR